MINPTAEVVSAPGGYPNANPSKVAPTTNRSRVNSGQVITESSASPGPHLLYDINYAGVQDKFVNSILHVGQFTGIIPNVDTEIYHKWCYQTDFSFGFVPLTEQIMPKDMSVCHSKPLSPFDMHSIVKATQKPNYMEARLPVNSQLNVEAWKTNLSIRTNNFFN